LGEIPHAACLTDANSTAGAGTVVAFTIGMIARIARDRQLRSMLLLRGRMVTDYFHQRAAA
jgi:hypothetical protein